MLSLVEGDLEKVGFHGCFERVDVDVTDLTHRAESGGRGGPGSEGCCFCVAYLESACVCRRAKLSRGCVCGQELMHIG